MIIKHLFNHKNTLLIEVVILIIMVIYISNDNDNWHYYNKNQNGMRHKSYFIIGDEKFAKFRKW